jgi:hypothetical protein
MKTTYKTKVEASEWNGETTYRPYILQAGRWKRFGETQFSTYEACAADLRELERQHPDFVFVEDAEGSR